MGEMSVEGGTRSRTSPNCVRCRNHNLKESLKSHKLYCRYRNCTCDKCLQTVVRQRMMADQIARRRRKEQEAAREELGLPVQPPTPDSDQPPPPDQPPDQVPLRLSSQTDDHNIEKYRGKSAISGMFSNSSSSSSTLYPASSNGSDVSVTGLSIASNNSNTSRPNSHNSSNDVNNSNSSNGSISHSMNIFSIVDSTVSSSRPRNSEPVSLESVLKLSELLYNQVDIHSLLYMILKEVNSDVDEARRRIVKAQDEIRNLKSLSAAITVPTPLTVPLPLLPTFNYARFQSYLRSYPYTYPPYYPVAPPRPMCDCCLKVDKSVSTSLEV